MCVHQLTIQYNDVPKVEKIILLISARNMIPQSKTADPLCNNGRLTKIIKFEIVHYFLKVIQGSA